MWIKTEQELKIYFPVWRSLLRDEGRKHKPSKHLEALHSQVI